MSRRQIFMLPLKGSLPKPAAPTSLIVSQNGSGQVDLAWVSNSDNEDGFAIYRSTNGILYTKVGTVGVGVTTYSDTGLASGYYYYKVRAFNGGGNSPFSNVDSCAVFLERDEFVTDDAAPIASPRTMEPGPGTLTTVADTGSHGSIVSGELRTDGGAVNNTDPLYVGAVRTRAVGLAFGLNMRQAGDTTEFIGWRTAQSGAVTLFRGAFRMVSLQVYHYNNGVFTYTGLTFALNTTYQLVDILLPSGVAMYIKGGAYTDWTVAWVDRAGSVTPMNPGLARSTTAVNHFMDNWSVVQLGDPFDTAFGFADFAVEGAVTDGQAFTHDPNFVGYMVVATRPDPGEEILFRFSMLDENNHWHVAVTDAGTLILREVIAGVATPQGTSVGAVAAGERIGVRRILATSAILVYDTTSTNPLITKGGVGSFTSETDGDVVIGAGGAVSALEIHNSTAAAGIQDELDRFFG